MVGRERVVLWIGYSAPWRRRTAFRSTTGRAAPGSPRVGTPSSRCSDCSTSTRHRLRRSATGSPRPGSPGSGPAADASCSASRRARAPLPGPGIVTLEDGGTAAVERELPADLPLGWHRLSCGGQERHPGRRPAPAARRHRRPGAGWCSSTRCASRASWGMGDLGDLRRLRRAGPARHRRRAGPAQPAARDRADAPRAGLAVLAVEPAVRQPALPAGRRHRRIPGAPTPPLRAQVDALRPDDGDLIDYDAVWQAKRAALELLSRSPRSDPAGADAGLTAFATYCALAERHGTNWRQWPAELRAPGQPRGRTRRRRCRRGSASTPGCSGSATSSSPRPPSAARRHAGRDRARPRGRGRPGRRRRLAARRRARRRASGSARRRTRSTSSGRTGGWPPGGPTGWRRPATPPYRDMLRAHPPARAAACGSTTSPGCRGCGGSRRAPAPPRAPTCATTRTRCSASWRWRRSGPARS